MNYYEKISYTINNSKEKTVNGLGEGTAFWDKLYNAYAKIASVNNIPRS